MLLKKDKNGQFYLLAAIVIIAIIIGFASVSNYIKNKSSVTIYNLKDELGIEGAQVLDFGTVKAGEVSVIKTGSDVEYKSGKIIEHFTALYDFYKGENKEIYYIFGNSQDIVAYKYTDVVGGSVDISVKEGDASKLNILARAREELGIDKDSKPGKAIITIDENNYEFELKAGENFYFVISQNVGDEKYVAKS